MFLIRAHYTGMSQSYTVPERTKKDFTAREKNFDCSSSFTKEILNITCIHILFVTYTINENFFN